MAKRSAEQTLRDELAAAEKNLEVARARLELRRTRRQSAAAAEEEAVRGVERNVAYLERVRRSLEELVDQEPTPERAAELGIQPE